MSEYVWCHGPECHEYSTQDRIRGVGNNKVLRTRKVKTYRYGDSKNMYSYFCSNGCYNDFANKYIVQVIAIAPRHEPLETSIVVEKETKQGWNGTSYVDTTITKLDNRLE